MKLKKAILKNSEWAPFGIHPYSIIRNGKEIHLSLKEMWECYHALKNYHDALSVHNYYQFAREKPCPFSESECYYVSGLVHEDMGNDEVERQYYMHAIEEMEEVLYG